MGSSLLGLEGKRIMVLGGGFGMGESTVQMLAGQGAHVAVVDLLSERAEKVASEVARDHGVTTAAFSTDVTDDEAVLATIARVEEEFGPLDGMATVIGMAKWGSLMEISAEDWDIDHRRNLRYFFITARDVARRIIARGAQGSIVCVASVDGLTSSANHASYGAAKAGLVNLVRSMAAEWSHQGVRVNCVAPGGIATPRFPVTDPEFEAKRMAGLPMRRRGVTDDIAKGITFFLSDMANYVTGQTLAVDGGYTAVGMFDYAGRPTPK
ncbi:MAG TPA: SDR family oxidoreductase [Novosphingobium sp.]